MQIDYKFIVDLARPSKTNTLLVMQNDANTRVAHFYLMNNGLKFDPTGVMSVLITAKLPTGATIVQDAEFEPELDEDGDPVLDDNDNPVLTNEIIYALPSAITESAGKTVMVITMTGAQSQLSSFEFYVNTRNELYNFDDYSDESTFSGFRDLLDRSLEALAAAEDKIDQFNPTSFPLQLVNLKTEGGEAVSYVYNTTASVQVNFAYALDRLAALEASFPAGCQTIYEGACAAGGGDIAPASSNPSDLAAFYMTVKNYWIGQTKVGNATANMVLSNDGENDISFVSAEEDGVPTQGTMANNGEMIFFPETAETISVAEGYYSGGTVSTVPAYAAGYDAGHAKGLEDGTYTVKFENVYFTCHNHDTGNGFDVKWLINPDGTHPHNIKKIKVYVRSAYYDNAHDTPSKSKHAYVLVGTDHYRMDSNGQTIEVDVNDPTAPVGLVNPVADNGASNLRLDIELTVGYYAP